jgi:signal transduction histidine kinase
MSFRLRIAAWFALSVFILVGVLIITAHRHLDEELRADRWDRSHPSFPGWVIHGSYTDEEVYDILGELIHVWLWVGIPLLGASVAAGYLIALHSARPIRQINRELAALTPDSFGHGVHLPEKDAELATLVHHINDLLGRVSRSYNEMAEFSANVAHELRTPLTLLRMRVESSAPLLPEEVSEEMQEEIRRLSQMVERSLLAAKADGGRLDLRIRDIDLRQLLEDLREDYARLAEEKRIPLEWRLQPTLTAGSDQDVLRQILHNLLGNAIRHGSDQARITARCLRRQDRIQVCVSNRIRPGYVSQPSSGLGLRLVQSLTTALPHVSFRTRKTPAVFAVRLTIPSGGITPG